MILLTQGFLHVHLQEFDGLSKFVMLWMDFPESHFGSSKYFLNFRFYAVA